MELLNPRLCLTAEVKERESQIIIKDENSEIMVLGRSYNLNVNCYRRWARSFTISLKNRESGVIAVALNPDEFPTGYRTWLLDVFNKNGEWHIASRIPCYGEIYGIIPAKKQILTGLCAIMPESFAIGIKINGVYYTNDPNCSDDNHVALFSFDDFCAYLAGELSINALISSKSSKTK